MIIECRGCGVVGEQAKGQGRLCPDCSKAYQRQYRSENKARLSAYFADRDARNRTDATWVAKERKRGRDYWVALRDEVIMAYGGYRCACCGEAERAFLTIDHIFNDGAKHRRSMGYSGNGEGASSATLSWLKKHGFPAGFQVLCSNCNFGKFINKGVCPHKAGPRHEIGVNSGEAQTG